MQHTMYFEPVHSCPPLTPLGMTHCLQFVLGLGHRWNMDDLPGATPLKKSDSLPPSQQLLSWNADWCSLVQVTTAAGSS